MLDIDKIHLGDCLELMKQIPDGTVDCVICDLPYGTTANKWDSLIPFDELWKAYRRVCKQNAAICLFGQQPFVSSMIMSNPTAFRYEWIWQKEMGTGFLNAKKCPLRDHENIEVFYDAFPTYNPIMRKGTPYKCKKGSITTNYHNKVAGIITESNGERYPLTVLRFDRDADTFHPTQKPVDLVRYLVETYTNEGDLVLDNCMGSGTTAIACHRSHRHFIGMEMNEEYWRKACERLDNERKQLTLFL